MARSDAPFGFKPINSSGGPYTGPVMKCSIIGANSNAFFVGDLVAFEGTGTTFGTTGATVTGLPGVTLAAAGGPILGPIVGFAHDPSNLESNYFVASTANDRVCYVATVTPTTLLIAQEDAVGAALTIADIGSTTNHVLGAGGSTTYGISGQMIDSNGSISTSASAGLRIVGLYNDPDNDEINTGTTAGTVWVVTVNEAQLGTGLVTVGV